MQGQHGKLVAGRQKVQLLIWRRLDRHAQEINDGVAGFVDRGFGNAFAAQVVCGNPCRREMAGRDSRDSTPEPFLGERIAKARAAETSFHVCQRQSKIARRQRTRVGRSRVTLDQDVVDFPLACDLANSLAQRCDVSGQRRSQQR